MRGGAVSSILKGKSWRFNCYNSADFFHVNAKENEKKRQKKDQQLSSGIKVYTEKSLNVGFEFMLIMVTLPFHAKLCFIKNEIYKECAVRFYAICFSLNVATIFRHNFFIF